MPPQTLNAAHIAAALTFAPASTETTDGLRTDVDASVSVEAVQTRSVAQKKLGRDNIGAGAAGDMSLLGPVGVGPDGWGYIPYAAHGVRDYRRVVTTGTRTGSSCLAIEGVFATFWGSGTFGPAASDVLRLEGATKANRFDSMVNGEVGIRKVYVGQSCKGDAFVDMGEICKVMTGTAADEGGITAQEFKVYTLTPANERIRSMHVINGFFEGPGGVSGGKGYGNHVSVRKGHFFSGNHTSTQTGPIGAPGDPDYYAGDGDAYEGENSMVYGHSTGTSHRPEDVTWGVQNANGAMDVGKPAYRTTIAANAKGVQFLNDEYGAYVTILKDGRAFAQMWEGDVLRTRPHTVGTAPTPTLYGDGTWAFFWDGDHGLPCLACVIAGAWKYGPNFEFDISAT